MPSRLPVIGASVTLFTTEFPLEIQGTLKITLDYQKRIFPIVKTNKLLNHYRIKESYPLQITVTFIFNLCRDCCPLGPAQHY